MRGNDEQQGAVFSYVSAEQRIAAEHPLRRIRAMTDTALRELSAEFDGLYAAGGRPSIAPERLLRALLLQVLYSRRSERLLMEEMNYNLLFGWFVGLEMDDEVWDVTVFTKNRERLIAGEVAQKFFTAVLKQARGAAVLSDEHFTVDGRLIEAWANRRSFVEKQDPPQRGTGARGRKLLRDTHESKTDPEARLFRRSQAAESRPSYLGHVITENRNGLVMAACVTQSSTKAEREAALAMLPQISDGRRRIGSMALAFGNIFAAGDGFRDVSAGVTQPIFEGGTLMHRERAARAAYVQADEQYRSTVLTAFQNVADTLNALQQDADGLKAAAAAKDAAAVTLDLAKKQFQAGYINYLGLLSAEQAYQQAVINLAQAEGNRYADTAALFQALGGGWWNRSDVPQK